MPVSPASRDRLTCDDDRNAVGSHVARRSSPAARSRVGFIARFFLAGMLAAGLASVQILPTVEWLPELGNRLASVWNLLPLSQAVGLVSRDILRHPELCLPPVVPEAAAYAGMTGLLLVALSAFHDRRRYAAFFELAIVGSSGIAYGVEPFRWVAEHIPILKNLKNWRLIGAADFGIAVTAGLGLSALEQHADFTAARKRRAAFSLALAAGLINAAVDLHVSAHDGCQSGVHEEPGVFRRPSFRWPAVPIFWRLFGGLRGRLFAWKRVRHRRIRCHHLRLWLYGFFALERNLSARPAFRFSSAAVRSASVSTGPGRRDIFEERPHGLRY